MFNLIRRRKVPEEGQGLVEYALVLVLVSIVVIVIVATLGDSIVKVFCQIVTTVDPNVDAPICSKLSVSCVNQGGGKFAATASSPSGETITEIKFFSNGTYVRTEFQAQYCFSGGDSPCNSQSIPSGTVISAVAKDAKGNTGTCSITAP